MIEPGLIVVLALLGVALNAAILYFVIRLAVTHALAQSRPQPVAGPGAAAV